MQKYGKTLKHGRIFPIFFNFAVKINSEMKYFEVIFHISAPSDMAGNVNDVIAAMAGEAGFETFDTTAEGELRGYVQQALYDSEMLDSIIESQPFGNSVQITYSVSEAEYKNWNETWEEQGFEPIYIGNNLLICDGRHLPLQTTLQGVTTVQINTRMAFGTGNHQTTRLMAQALIDLYLSNLSVLDCGTGTGVLAIIALLRGAAYALGYDIDEWSADNARLNARLNGVEDRMDIREGDSNVIAQAGRHFNVVTANINRNILLADMPRMKQALKPRGYLLLSGFYHDDAPLLLSKAEGLGLSLLREYNEEEWTCLVFLSDER